MTRPTRPTGQAGLTGIDDDERHRLTLEALADVAAGRLIEHETVLAWADKHGWRST